MIRYLQKQVLTSFIATIHIKKKTTDGYIILEFERFIELADAVDQLLIFHSEQQAVKPL